MKKTITLLIPEKTDIEFEQVFVTWTKNGGAIKRLGKYWIKDEALANETLAIYGNQTFAYVLAQIYNLELLSPDDTFIARLDVGWTKRSVFVKQIDQVTEEDFPVFIKPVIPKIFLANIFQNITDFRKSTNGLDKNEAILVSNIVENIEAEARSFVLNGVVKDIALYEGTADLVEAKLFLEAFLEQYKMELPKTVVIDLAFSKKTGWFILEFNACWGAGLNNCKAENVMECIIAATINK